MKEFARGTKRNCLTCGVAFFDLQHDPILCPKCSAVFTPVPIPRTIGYKKRTRFPVRQPLTDEPQVVLVEEVPETDPDDEGRLEGQEPERIGDDPEESEPEGVPDGIRDD